MSLTIKLRSALWRVFSDEFEKRGFDVTQLAISVRLNREEWKQTANTLRWWHSWKGVLQADVCTTETHERFCATSNVHISRIGNEFQAEPIGSIHVESIIRFMPIEEHARLIAKDWIEEFYVICASAIANGHGCTAAEDGVMQRASERVRELATVLSASYLHAIIDEIKQHYQRLIDAPEVVEQWGERQVLPVLSLDD